MVAFENLTGHRFGRLVVLGRAGTDKNAFVLWKCRCDCGKVVDRVRTPGLKKGKAKSCGCLNRERVRALHAKNANEMSALRRLYYETGASARQRELSFTLTLEVFIELVKSDCVYCGAPPSRVFRRTNKGGMKAHSLCVVNGIDRRDNQYGYETLNCVTACELCNRAKSAMGEVEFVAWIDRLARHRKFD